MFSAEHFPSLAINSSCLGIIWPVDDVYILLLASNKITDIKHRKQSAGALADDSRLVTRWRGRCQQWRKAMLTLEQRVTSSVTSHADIASRVRLAKGSGSKQQDHSLTLPHTTNYRYYFNCPFLSTWPILYLELLQERQGLTKKNI